MNWLIPSLFLLFLIILSCFYNAVTNIGGQPLHIFNESLSSHGNCWFKFGDETKNTTLSLSIYELLSALLFMILPLIFNIVGYYRIIHKLNKMKGLRSSSLAILIRAVFICIVFTLRWVPQCVHDFECDVRGRNGTIADSKHYCKPDSDWSATAKVCIFISCLLDPIVYLTSPAPILRCLGKKIKLSTKMLSPKMRHSKVDVVTDRELEAVSQTVSKPNTDLHEDIQPAE